MDTGEFVQSKFAQALKTQSTVTRSHPCPYPGHEGRIFPNAEQLYDHGRIDHRVDFEGLNSRQARDKFRELSVKFRSVWTDLRYTTLTGSTVNMVRRSDHSSAATAGDRSAPDIGGLTLDSEKNSRQNSPPSGRKRPAEHEFTSPRGKGPSHVEIVDSEYSRQIPHTVVSDRTRPKPHDARLFDPKQSTKGTSSPYQTTPEPSSEWSMEATKSNQLQSSHPLSPAHSTERFIPRPQQFQRQSGLIELQRYDPRFPGLLLKPDSRPISQEQLASEVESIYSTLTMVEAKCIRVDLAQAKAFEENAPQPTSGHWQALIALHRTLLHEHHDFFLAIQHPSASPALRRLAAKRFMPARMWKHGIHSFLELLRMRLPESIDYMLAFIYLGYQMMALLHETVPALDDTWIERLGDLGRYRMAIEDKDFRDRETWVGVARSWYKKAADKNPTVGRLYHHMAILARPDAMQQMYYYSRSLTTVKPFEGARESILTLFDPILGRPGPTLTTVPPNHTSFIKAHSFQFEKTRPLDKQRENEQALTFGFLSAKPKFIEDLDKHIGRVTAEWKVQGVYTAIANIAGWFQYGLEESILRQIFLHKISSKQQDSDQSDFGSKTQNASAADQQNPKPELNEEDILKALKGDDTGEEKVEPWAKVGMIPHAILITYETFALVLGRIGDENVLPHVHVMLAFLWSIVSGKLISGKLISEKPISDLIEDAPWTELVAFLNALVKTENQIQSQTQSQIPNIHTLLAQGLFPAEGERIHELPLPEDYLVRGLIWADDYFPKKWFERDHDGEERYSELTSTVKKRIERVLRLGHALSQVKSSYKISRFLNSVISTEH
ncbi:telomerase-binding protein est1a protein [Stemphylium lycopersici]|uniref:Telomerase-binding protein est1a protein n=1 Tax=Stemphylium lycopersici TaxID=183478 RepID=A0A364NDX9_STELY|nr:telomerase-binding protein est1a protein [Stemphylium lycopersici]